MTRPRPTIRRLTFDDLASIDHDEHCRANGNGSFCRSGPEYEIAWAVGWRGGRRPKQGPDLARIPKQTWSRRLVCRFHAEAFAKRNTLEMPA